MKAMILAAGRGERMRPLTDTTPKPLLVAGGKPIIQHTIEKLVSSGFTELVINVSYLGKQIMNTLGDGQQWGASIAYSDECDAALETAGGIIKALPLLGDEPFLVVNGDIAHTFDFASLHARYFKLAHLVLIPNPLHHPEGDFHLGTDSQLSVTEEPKLTYSGIGLFDPKLFKYCTPGKQKLARLLRQEMAKGNVSGEAFTDFWLDIGTPQRLSELDNYYNTQSK